ncbi:hypothetical protein PF010_g12266 [Phytophthora fragariae]|uniref:CASP-like protein n=1 Tax=Phytophthora fragariae TaxID=53985 RepID=A0A6A3K5U5_9STRA|nr:hypothetical protein PF011_g13274 [Phytophthora fragariae]KAE9107460.1 hypothetical protein PF010_g12266 [Phytophthora fragariae]KAE9221685.1 hypothetical protein PF004_g12992 [Phytophthora fragariae]KAE9336561.1 hypothetical protein PF008_g12964 [Phytophthora fragariae]
MPSKSSRRAKKKKGANGPLTVLTPEQKWWRAVGRLAQFQLGCSLLMQLSYVAFPAYNFSLALWCLLACTPSWSAKYTRLVPLHMIAISFSVVTDVIWMSLWVSGKVFFDQFCNASAVSIVSCGGATDHFPGCSTNQFALFTLILNLLAKIATVASMQRIQAIHVANRAKHRSQVAAADRTSDTSSAATGAEVKPLPDSTNTAGAAQERTNINDSSGSK